MTVQGKPAALIAITALLTLTLALVPGHHSKTTAPQVVPQAVEEPVDNSLREMSLLRASRSRSVPGKAVNTKNTKLEMPLVASHPRSTKPRSHHHSTSEHTSVFASASAWAHSTSAIKVANCESGDRHSWDRYNGDPHMRDGAYHGKWQMNSDFWKSYGGLQFVADAADASESEQDEVAYRGYLARGWQPWSCARIMGII